MKTSEIIHGPAERVGKRRVSRKPIKKRLVDSKETHHEMKNDSDVLSHDENKDLLPKLLVHTFQERQTRNIRAQVTSRQFGISSNPGTNVKYIYINNAQPRGLSH